MVEYTVREGDMKLKGFEQVSPESLSTSLDYGRITAESQFVWQAQTECLRFLYCRDRESRLS